MDAIELLMNDHKAAKKAMEEIAKSSGAKKQTLFSAFKREIEAHDSIEEDIFYPAVQSHPRTLSFPAKDKEAHQVVETALEELAELPVDDSDWMPTFRAMQDRLLKHVADEETNLFVKIRSVLSGAELNELGDKMKIAKEQWLNALGSTA